jgi:hypothetical protein
LFDDAYRNTLALPINEFTVFEALLKACASNQRMKEKV